MPTYEYVCQACGKTIEVVQKMTDPSLAACPECGGELRKVFHPAGIMFKGSGFYATDNRSKPKTSTTADSGSSSSDSSDSKTSGSKGDPKKSESKSESKKSESSSESKSSESKGAGDSKGTSGSKDNGSGSKSSGDKH
jgi:putative FmdB family regulatory protein